MSAPRRAASSAAEIAHHALYGQRCRRPEGLDAHHGLLDRGGSGRLRPGRHIDRQGGCGHVGRLGEPHRQTGPRRPRRGRRQALADGRLQRGGLGPEHPVAPPIMLATPLREWARRRTSAGCRQPAGADALAVVGVTCRQLIAGAQVVGNPPAQVLEAVSHIQAGTWTGAAVLGPSGRG